MKRFLAWSAAFGLLGALTLFAVFVSWNWRDVFARLPQPLSGQPVSVIEEPKEKDYSKPSVENLEARCKVTRHRGGHLYREIVPCNLAVQQWSSGQQLTGTITDNIIYTNSWSGGAP